MGNRTLLAPHWRLLIAAVCGSAAIFVTLVLVTRLPQATVPLNGWWTFATWLFVGGLSAAGCALARESGTTPPAFNLACGMMAAAVTTAALLATTHLAGPTQLAVAGGLSFASFLVVLGEYAQASIARPVAAATAEQPELNDKTPADSVPESLTLMTDSAVDDPEGPSSLSLPDHFQQTSSRYIADGRDCLEACLRVRFEPGQQTAIVHVPIQPAMPCDPEVECEPAGGDEVRVTVDPAQPYGIRLVCRRSSPCADAGESIIAVLISSERLAAAA